MTASTLSIAWRNLGRNRRRTALAVGAVALGQLTLVFVNGLMAGMFNDMQETITGPMVGHVQVHHADWPEERAPDLQVERLGEARRGIEAVEGVAQVSPRAYSAVLAARGAKSDEPAEAEPAMVIGLDVGAETGRKGLLEGLEAPELPRGREVVLGRMLARNMGLGKGDTIAIVGQDADGFPVTGLFAVRGVVAAPVDVVSRLGIVMALADAQEFLAMPDRAHEIVVRCGREEDSERVAGAVRTLPSLGGLEVLPWREAVPELANLIEFKDVTDLIFVGILFLAAAAGIANTMMMSTFERTREFGMLLAVGASPWRIVRMVLAEAVVLGVVGVAVGSVLGAAVTVLTSHTGIDYGVVAGIPSDEYEFAYEGLSFSLLIYPAFEMKHVTSGLAAVVATSVLTALWPAALAARLEPVEAMRS